MQVMNKRLMTIGVIVSFMASYNAKAYDFQITNYSAERVNVNLHGETALCNSVQFSEPDGLAYGQSQRHSLHMGCCASSATVYNPRTRREFHVDLTDAQNVFGGPLCAGQTFVLTGSDGDGYTLKSTGYLS